MHQINIKKFEDYNFGEVKAYMQNLGSNQFEIHIDSFDYDPQQPSTIFWNYCAAAWACQFLHEGSECFEACIPTPEKMESFRFGIVTDNLENLAGVLIYLAYMYPGGKRSGERFKALALDYVTDGLGYPLPAICQLLVDLAKRYAGPNEMNSEAKPDYN